MRFVDTNILLYAAAVNAGNDAKQRAASVLLREHDLALSVQVLQEFYVQATRPNRTAAMYHEEAALFMQSLLHLPVQPVTLQVFHTALDYRQRFRLSYWDSAILAAAKLSGCDTLLTEDLNPGQDYDGVRAINPFTS